MRETVEAEGEGEGYFERVIEDVPYSCRVRVRVSPRKRGEGVRVFLSESLEGLPENIREALLLGVEEGSGYGAFGYPVEDISVEVLSAEFPHGNHLPQITKVACASAFLEAYRAASPVLLEPIMSIEITVPEDFLGGVMGDFSSRGGKVTSVDKRPGISVINGTVPLRRMFGYATDLRSLTQGRGSFTMKFLRFDRS